MHFFSDITYCMTVALAPKGWQVLKLVLFTVVDRTLHLHLFALWLKIAKIFHLSIRFKGLKGYLWAFHTERLSSHQWTSLMLWSVTVTKWAALTHGEDHLSLTVLVEATGDLKVKLSNRMHLCPFGWLLLMSCFCWCGFCTLKCVDDQLLVLFRAVMSQYNTVWNLI